MHVKHISDERLELNTRQVKGVTFRRGTNGLDSWIDALYKGGENLFRMHSVKEYETAVNAMKWYASMKSNERR